MKGLVTYTNSATTDTAWVRWVGTGSGVTVTASTITSATRATHNVWRTWVTNGFTCGTGNTASDGWSLTDSACPTDSVWGIWQRVAPRIEHVRTAPPPPTPEERARASRIASEDAAKRLAASKRARQLLCSVLTPEQRETYERSGYFDVEIPGRGMFRITQGTHGNVARIDDKGPIERYCVQPTGVPVEDSMLSQLLALKFCPAEFFGKANVTRIRN